MSRRAPFSTWFWLAPLALASCFENARVDHGVAEDRGGVTAQAGTGGPRRVRVPTVQAPEQLLAALLREYQVRDTTGSWERHRERLLSDGQGAYRLDILEHQPAGQSQFAAPSDELLGRYERRQRYFVRYRDAHLRDAGLAQANYAWTEQRHAAPIAGRACRVYRAQSQHGFGAIELTVDAADGTLFGWALFDAENNEMQRLTTASIQLDPDLSGVVWSQPATVERDYLDSDDDRALLGFTPLRLVYVPEGFVHERALILVPNDASIRPLYLDVFHDGLQVVLVAQQSTGAGPGTIPPAPLHFVRNASIGGVGVVEGEVAGVNTYVAGALPLDELNMMIGSLQQ